MAKMTGESSPARDKSIPSSVIANAGIGGGKPTLGLNIRQHITGKLDKDASPGMLAMGVDGGSDKGLGQMVTTVKSNPITGPANVQKGNTAMGSGSVINGYV